jgi:hypothetical protein
MNALVLLMLLLASELVQRYGTTTFTDKLQPVHNATVIC